MHKYASLVTKNKNIKKIDRNIAHKRAHLLKIIQGRYAYLLQHKP